MTDPVTVAVIGLGAMGAALARAQLVAGHITTVWNRSPAKAEALAAKGANVAETAVAAVQAADITLICLDTHASGEAALDDVLQPDGLTGRVIVQLGTSMPAEARAFAARVAAAGGQALDGAIMFYPDTVGPDSDGPLMIAGADAAYDAALPVLRQLSGNLIHLGDNLAAPSALDLGLLTISASLYVGIAHAANLVLAEGADVGMLAKLCPHGPRAAERLEIIARDAYPLGSLYDGGSLGVWTDVAGHISDHARAAGINSELPDLLRDLYRRAAAEHADQDVAALIKTLRTNPFPDFEDPLT